MVNTSRTETTLDDFESTSPAADDVVKRYADVVVDDLVVALGGIVVAELLDSQVSDGKRGRTKETTHHLHRADEGESLGVGRDDDDTLLLVLAGRGVTLCGREGQPRRSKSEKT